MKKFKFFIIFFVFMFIFLNKNLNANINSLIISKVNNQVITTIDLENELKTYFIMNNIEFSKTNINQYKNLILDGMIKRLIKTHEIKKFKIQDYSVDELKSYLNDVAKTKGLSLIELQDFFKKNNLNYFQFEENIRTQLKWNRLILILYAKEVNLSESEIQTEFKKYINNNQAGEKSYKISEIVIDLKDKNKISEIQNYINKQGFERAASTFSTSNSSVKGGSLGWLSTSEINTSLLSVIKNLKPGEISKPLERLDQLMIFKLNDIKNIKRTDKDIEIIKKNIVNRLRSEKLNFFSISHFSKAEKASIIKILK